MNNHWQRSWRYLHFNGGLADVFAIGINRLRQCGLNRDVPRLEDLNVFDADVPARNDLRKMARQRRSRGDRTVEHDHSHVRPRVARRQRLAVRPHSQHRVRRPGVVLGDDDDLHQLRCTARVRSASWRGTYGREARNSRASATARSRS